MIPKLILLQLIAHLLADFIFQPQKWSDRKAKKVLSIYHLYHALVVFAFSYLLSLDWRFWKMALMLTAIHLFTDMLKSLFQIKSQKQGKSKNYFFADQLIHLIVLTIISATYAIKWEENYMFDISHQHISVIAGFILLSKPTNIIIKNLFIEFSVEIPSDNSNNDVDDKSLPNAGKLIGMSERFLVFALILVSQYAAVGLVIAAKSVLRYKSSQKNEYILVGTLLSFGMAALVGISASTLFK